MYNSGRYLNPVDNYGRNTNPSAYAGSASTLLDEIQQLKLNMGKM